MSIAPHRLRVVFHRLVIAQLFAWWILVYLLVGLVVRPPDVGSIWRFAIFYGLLVASAIPVSVALVWVGRNHRLLPWWALAILTVPSLLWAALVCIGVQMWDGIDGSVVAVQVAVAAYFLSLGAGVVAATRRFAVGKPATNRALGILLAAQVACYSIEVWRLTAYREERVYGAVLADHDLFSPWTFGAAALATAGALLALGRGGLSPSLHRTTSG